MVEFLGDIAFMLEVFILGMGLIALHYGRKEKSKLVKSGGAWYTLKYNDEDIKFQAKDFEEVLNRDGMKDYLYDLICEKLIMKYKEKPDYTIGENVEYDNEVEE